MSSSSHRTIRCSISDERLDIWQGTVEPTCKIRHPAPEFAGCLHTYSVVDRLTGRSKPQPCLSQATLPARIASQTAAQNYEHNQGLRWPRKASTVTMIFTGSWPKT